MTALLAVIVRVALCVLDLGSFAAIVETEHGPRASVVLPRNACPASLYSPGWHISLGIPICSRGCGADDIDDNTRIP